MSHSTTLPDLPHALESLHELNVNSLHVCIIFNLHILTLKTPNKFVRIWYWNYIVLVVRKISFWFIFVLMCLFHIVGWMDGEVGR
jgi:hypothetical protein